MKWPLIWLVRGYQLIVSPYLGPTCRYYPSCSAYAVEALRVHGAFKGTWLAVRRLGRCHPWSPGGVDHVPPRRGATAEHTHDQPHDGATDLLSPTVPEPLPTPVGSTPPQQGA